MELSSNEKKLLIALAPRREASPSELAEVLGIREDAIIQHAHLLEDRGLATIERIVTTTYTLTPEGLVYRENGLPERQLISTIREDMPVAEVQKNPLARIAIGWLKKKGWVTIRDGIISPAGTTPQGEDEIALKDLSTGGKGVQDLVKRGLAVPSESVTYILRPTETGIKLVQSGLCAREETGTLSREQIISGAWKTMPLRKYDVTKVPRRIYPGKKHPYQQMIDEMRQILLEMGFTEIQGGLVQSSFWNFDALFQPQDHPAREMQDTFYLSEKMKLPKGFENVKAMHEHGGETSSTGWGGTWNSEKAEQCVLRTHTTCLSIQHLATHITPPVKAFCISRVYRRESIDPTHLPEFEQLEGIVMDTGVTFRHLLGFLKEFYGRMGFEGVRFRPAYFPYTEPSVEPEVWVEGLGWVEMGGAGIFRQEVTAPWGIRHPVLAWGLGVSRVAMLKMGLKDLRQLYRTDIGMIRDTPVYTNDHATRGGD